MHKKMLPFLERVVLQTRLADDPALFESASPLFHVDRSAPPFFVLHGANDPVIPATQAQAFRAALHEAGAETVCYAELPNAHHAFDAVATIRSQLVAPMMEPSRAARCRLMCPHSRDAGEVNSPRGHGIACGPSVPRGRHPAEWPAAQCETLRGGHRDRASTRAGADRLPLAALSRTTAWTPARCCVPGPAQRIARRRASPVWSAPSR
jgi:hypothetical protein